MTTKHNNPTLENVADDEPIFVLRARDVLAPEVVGAWADKMKERGGDSDKKHDALVIADQMREWQRRNGSKLPD